MFDWFKKMVELSNKPLIIPSPVFIDDEEEGGPYCYIIAVDGDKERLFRVKVEEVIINGDEQ